MVVAVVSVTIVVSAMIDIGVKVEIEKTAYSNSYRSTCIYKPWLFHTDWIPFQSRKTDPFLSQEQNSLQNLRTLDLVQRDVLEDDAVLYTKHKGLNMNICM